MISFLGICAEPGAVIAVELPCPPLVAAAKLGMLPAVLTAPVATPSEDSEKDDDLRRESIGDATGVDVDDEPPPFRSVMAVAADTE